MSAPRSFWRAHAATRLVGTGLQLAGAYETVVTFGALLTVALYVEAKRATDTICIALDEVKATLVALTEHAKEQGGGVRHLRSPWDIHGTLGHNCRRQLAINDNTC